MTIQQITILESYLTRDELWIAYSIEGVPDEIIIDDANQIAELLKDAGIVENTKLWDGMLCVKAEYETNKYETQPRWVEWNDYLQSFELSQIDCLKIVKAYYDKKEAQKLINLKNEMIQSLKNIAV